MPDIDLADRITALETANTDLTSRVTTAENTLKAISDTVANLAPGNVADAATAIADIRDKTNDFYKRVFGDVLFTPAPTPE